MKALNIIETAYRATLEEQDDTVVWLMHAMRGAGAELAVLLRGNAVNYGVRAQDASGLVLGGVIQMHPPRLAADVAKLIEKGVPVFCIKEDVAARAIAGKDLIDNLGMIGKAELPGLCKRYDQIWHW